MQLARGIEMHMNPKQRSTSPHKRDIHTRIALRRPGREGSFNQLETRSARQSTDQSLIRLDRPAAAANWLRPDTYWPAIPHQLL